MVKLNIPISKIFVFAILVRVLYSLLIPIHPHIFNEISIKLVPWNILKLIV